MQSENDLGREKGIKLLFSVILLRLSATPLGASRVTSGGGRVAGMLVQWLARSFDTHTQTDTKRSCYFIILKIKSY